MQIVIDVLDSLIDEFLIDEFDSLVEVIYGDEIIKKYFILESKVMAIYSVQEKLLNFIMLFPFKQ